MPTPRAVQPPTLLPKPNCESGSIYFSCLSPPPVRRHPLRTCPLPVIHPNLHDPSSPLPILPFPISDSRSPALTFLSCLECVLLRVCRMHRLLPPPPPTPTPLLDELAPRQACCVCPRLFCSKDSNKIQTEITCTCAPVAGTNEHRATLARVSEAVCLICVRTAATRRVCSFLVRSAKTSAAGGFAALAWVTNSCEQQTTERARTVSFESCARPRQGRGLRCDATRCDAAVRSVVSNGYR
jgi:hypothetical protein